MTLVSNQWQDVPIAESLTRLFDGNGTVYLVPGYFTREAYALIRDDIVAFLERDPENELLVVVSPTADQFTPSVGRDLRGLGDRVQVYAYPHGCLHAKLYLRVGPEPFAIIGSVNLTRVALEQNVELGLIIEPESAGADAGTSRARIDRLAEWTEELVATSRPIRGRDLHWPVMAFNSLSIWVNKARLLPRRRLVHQPFVYLVIFLVVVYLAVST